MRNVVRGFERGKLEKRHGKPNCIGFTVQLETTKILLGYDQDEYPRVVLVRAVAALIPPALARAPPEAVGVGHAAVAQRRPQGVLIVLKIQPGVARPININTITI